jgi:hypothetical protein
MSLTLFKEEGGLQIGSKTKQIKPGSLDFLVNSCLIAMGAELFDFQPFGGVSTVLLCGVSGHPRTPF